MQQMRVKPAKNGKNRRTPLVAIETYIKERRFEVRKLAYPWLVFSSVRAISPAGESSEAQREGFRIAKTAARRIVDAADCLQDVFIDRIFAVGPQATLRR